MIAVIAMAVVWAAASYLVVLKGESMRKKPSDKSKSSDPS